MISSRYALIAVFASLLLASGCANTIRGIGKDAANTVNATRNAGSNVSSAVQ